MNRLEDLKRRVEALPTKRQHQNLVASLRSFGMEAKKVHATVAQVIAVKGASQKVFSDLNLGKVELSLSAAVRHASTLLKAFDADRSSVSREDFNAAVTKLREAADQARSAFRSAWSLRLERKLSGYLTAVESAHSVGLASAATLQKSLRHLIKSEPPTNSEEAVRCCAELAEAEAEVFKLRMVGPAAAFLTKAIQGIATVEDLEQPEVRAFLKEQKLLGRLTIRLQ